MAGSGCDRLDGYLAGSLPPPEATEFEGHLEGCPACRREVRADRRLDDLLARAAGLLESPPASLRASLALRVRAGRRRKLLAGALGGLAAAALVILSAWPRHRDGPDVPPARLEAAVPAAEKAPRTPPVRVEFAPDAPVLAFLVETADPDVSIVFIYPTLGSKAAEETPPPDPGKSF